MAWTTAAGALSAGITAGGGALAVQAPGFPAKLQAGGTLGAVMTLPLAGWLDASAFIEAFGFLPSDVVGGVSYRGFSGGSMGLAAEAHGVLGSSRSLGLLAAGAIAGASLSLPSYSSTTLYFFMPQLFIGPAAWLTTPGKGEVTFRLALPLGVQLRKDTTFALSLGLSLAVLLNQEHGR